MANELKMLDTKEAVLATNTNNMLSAFMSNSDSWKLFMSKFPTRKQEAILYDLYAYVNKNAETVSKMEANAFMARVIDCYGQGFTLQDGDAYILPFGGVATLVPGYKGIVRLAMETGLFKYFDCVPVIGESIASFDYRRNVPIFNPKYNPNGKEKTIGYYAYSETHDGMVREIYHSNEYFEDFAHRKSPQNKGKNYLVGPWKDDFEAMCKKTGLKELGKLAPKVKNPTEQQSNFFNFMAASEEIESEQHKLIRPNNVDENGVMNSETLPWNTEPNESTKSPETQKSSNFVCAMCGKVLTEDFYNKSIKKYGVALCSKECLDDYNAWKADNE